MSDFVGQDDAEEALREELSETQWSQIEALLRRAERELTLLVGDLSRHDPLLVGDTLIDAIREEWTNPDRYRSETDNSYSYTRYSLPSGEQGRFWWPRNLYELFGIKRPGKKLRVLPIGVSSASRGWVR